MTRDESPHEMPILVKAPTGIEGLDEITGGGLPQGRPTLVYGGAGSGKTLLGMAFLINGIARYGEPGVFMSFEETESELATNVASLGFDLSRLVADGQLYLDHVEVERSEIEETGEYDLEGLFVRLGLAIDSIGAKRVVLDTIEVLFASLTNPGIVRAEIHRLFRWLKARGITAIVTGEHGDENSLTRHGLEEFVSDCVILLENQISHEMATRRLRIVKYRGSSHSTNEFPFTIGADGFWLAPVTGVQLDYPSSTEAVSTGVAQLDSMLAGRGYLRGSSILISGTVGAGKSSLAAHFVDAGCRRGEQCLYFAFEEAPSQIVRNMRSIGIDLQPWLDQGLLHVQAFRPSQFGLEKHLLTMEQAATRFNPSLVVVDAITDFTSMGSTNEVRWMALRMIDHFRSKQITTLFTSMATRSDLEETGVGLSSAYDTWIHLVNVLGNLERNRGLYVIKSRGMAHSNQMREFVLTSEGAKLLEVYAGASGAVMGAARVAQEAADRAAERSRARQTELRRRMLEEKRRVLNARIAALRAEFAAETKESDAVLDEQREDEQRLVEARGSVRRQRKAD